MSKRRKEKSSVGRFMSVFVIMVVVLSAARVICDKIRAADTDFSTNTIAPRTPADSLLTVRLPDGSTPELIEYTGFSIYFNPEMHQPNFAAWELTADETDGPVSRNRVSFQPDYRVEGSATLEDYRKSGFDRGHLVPAADMKWSLDAMTDCHYLTNICPQDNALNSGAWATVENKSRAWAKKYGRILIIAGPVLTDVITRYIGKNRVAVPERFFKVILAPDENPPRAVGYIMPNSKVAGGSDRAMATIDQVEAITGYDFFSALPDEIESQIESKNTLR